MINDNKTRVLILVPSLTHGGAETLVRNIALNGFRKEFTLAVCCLSGPHGNLIESNLLKNNVNLFFLGMRHLFDIRIPFALYKLFREFKPHVVHSHLNSLIYCLLPSVLAGVPVKIHTVHNTPSMEGKFPLRLASRIAFKLFDFVPVGISDIIGRNIETYYGLKNVPVINNGIPTGEYALSDKASISARSLLEADKDNVIFVHIGRFVSQKNHRLLIRAFSEALQSNPNLTLLLIGSGRFLGEIKTLVKELGIDVQTKFLGLRDDIPNILSASDVFVLSSDWEGLPITVIEAMAAGLPVVSTSVGGVPDLVKDGETGYLVKKGDLDGLAKAILKIASNMGSSRHMGDNAARFVRDKFDISRTVALHEDLYMKHLGINLANKPSDP